MNSKLTFCLHFFWAIPIHVTYTLCWASQILSVNSVQANKQKNLCTVLSHINFTTQSHYQINAQHTHTPHTNPSLSLYLQFLLDDLQILREPGVGELGGAVVVVDEVDAPATGVPDLPALQHGAQVLVTQLQVGGLPAHTNTAHLKSSRQQEGNNKKIIIIIYWRLIL